jgi:hypothetical protein
MSTDSPPSARESTTAIKPAGRTLAEFLPLRRAEEMLRAACQAGNTARIGESLPKSLNKDNSVRAGFVRFLALGGDDQAPVHEHGVQLQGAWVEGGLSLEGVRVSMNLTFVQCRFNSPLVLYDARIEGCISLGGCHVPEINGDRLACDGSLFMHHGFVVEGEVHLRGAQFGDSLDCSGATLNGKGGVALSADGAVIKGDVIFNGGFKAGGKVCLRRSAVTSIAAARPSLGRRVLSCRRMPWRPVEHSSSAAWQDRSAELASHPAMSVNSLMTRRVGVASLCSTDSPMTTLPGVRRRMHLPD